MESFLWDTSFATGLDKVDQQHYHLVGLINQFATLLALNEFSTSDLKKLYTELDDYTQYHFQEEEIMMQAVGIDSNVYSQHVAAHSFFLQKVSSMYNEISAEEPRSALEFLDFLAHWLIYHIMGMDKSMARQVAAIKAGTSAKEAYKAEGSKINGATEALLAAVSRLIQQVSERNAELKKLNQSLEAKVAARTHSLLEANKHLEELAVTDQLTNLPNRRYALSCLARLWGGSVQKGKPIACLMIDADYFKKVNDTYGHDAGDRVLIELSKKLQQSVRNDDIVCRLGGDEFLIICDNTDLMGAKHIANLLCKAVAELNVQVGNGVWKGSVSIGVAAKNKEMTRMEMLIKVADEGVYLAKQAGKNCVRSVN